MKTAIVPAQITTVEDRIAGNFTFSQLAFIAAPVALSAIVYVVFIPKLQLSILKLAMMVLLFALIAPLAIRVHGKTLATWFVVCVRYAMRPRIYVHTKADLMGRHLSLVQAAASEESTTENSGRALPEPRPLHEHIRVKQLLEDPNVSISFELDQKGGIDVSLTPIKR